MKKAFTSQNPPQIVCYVRRSVFLPLWFWRQEMVKAIIANRVAFHVVRGPLLFANPTENDAPGH